MGIPNKTHTPETERIEALLKEHFPDHPPDLPPTAYRYNPASIRIRIVSDRFKGKSRGEREDLVLPILRTLPDKIRQDITILVLLPRSELKKSPVNLEFEHPSPSPM
jgi:stress-induced morphogen